jgi:hypothetical protein
MILKEKNNALQLKLQEMLSLRADFEERSRRVSELETVNSNLKEENM